MDTFDQVLSFPDGDVVNASATTDTSAKLAGIAGTSPVTKRKAKRERKPLSCAR